MSDQRLLETIKHKISMGISEHEIVTTLVFLGWKEEDIKTAMPYAYGKQDTTPTMPSANTKDEKSKIVFEGFAAESNPLKAKKKKKLLPAILVLVGILFVAVIIFVQALIKINPNIFSGVFPWLQQQAPQVSIPSDPGISTAEGLKTYGPFNSAGKLTIMGNNFAFFYEKDGSQYVNINGSNSAPWQRFERKGIARSIVPSIYGNKYGYSYYDTKDVSKKGWFININGVVNGPFLDASNVYCSKGGCIYAKKDINDVYFYAHVNDNKYGPYVTIDNNVYLSDNGFYAFSYVSKSKQYINMNGKIYGPYDDTGNGILYRDEKFYFLYSEKGKQYLNLNGNVYEVSSAVVYDYQRYIFNCSYTKDGKNYVNVNGKEVLAGEQTEMEQLNVFKKDDGYHVSIKGQLKGIYPRTTPICANEDSFIFGYQAASGKWYVNINGVDKGPYQSVGSELFVNGEHYGYIFQQEGTWSVEIK